MSGLGGYVREDGSTIDPQGRKVGVHTDRNAPHPKAYAAKVNRLVEAAKYAITTNDWTPGPGTRRDDLRQALADLERKG